MTQYISDIISSWCDENLTYIQETQLNNDYYVTINKIITRFLFSDITIPKHNTSTIYNMYDLKIEVLEQCIIELCNQLSGSKLDYRREWNRLKNIGGFGNNLVDMNQFIHDIGLMKKN